ncbi:unnamed protein product, partial [Ilex paraguariensis]
PGKGDLLRKEGQEGSFAAVATFLEFYFWITDDLLCSLSSRDLIFEQNFHFMH